MTERDSKVLWDSLRERFENIESMILPKVKRDWQNLRYQDYKTVEDYNTALCGIVTRMKLCKLPVEDKDLIEKTLSTFHLKMTHISRQYKKENYKTYVELSNAMQQDQGEDETIMQNHLSWPTGSMAPPEANATSFKKKGDKKGKREQKAPIKDNDKKFKNFKKKQWKSKKIPSGGEYGKQDQECYKCGMRGHWSRICRTPKHIVNLYQEFKNQKKSMHETHYVEGKKSILEVGECSKAARDQEAPKCDAASKEQQDGMDIDKTSENEDLDLDNFEHDDLLGEETMDDVHGDSV